MAAKNFLKKATCRKVVFLYILFIGSVVVWFGDQPEGTIHSRDGEITGPDTMGLSRGPRIGPSATRSEKVSPAIGRASPPASSDLNREVTVSWYGPKHHNKRTASGQRFNMYKNTLAHRTLPFGTKVRLVNFDNGKSAEGVVTDRGPYNNNRDVDVSYGMARQLGFVRKGVVKLYLKKI